MNEAPKLISLIDSAKNNIIRAFRERNYSEYKAGKKDTNKVKQEGHTRT